MCTYNFASLNLHFRSETDMQNWVASQLSPSLYGFLEYFFYFSKARLFGGILLAHQVSDILYIQISIHMRFENRLYLTKIELAKYYPAQDISDHLEFLRYLHFRFLGVYIIPSCYCITFELSYCIKCHKTKNRDENCAKY